MVSNEVTAANRVAERAREEQFRFECKVAVLDQKAKAATVFAKEVEDKLAEERDGMHERESESSRAWRQEVEQARRLQRRTIGTEAAFGKMASASARMVPTTPGGSATERGGNWARRLQRRTIGTEAAFGKMASASARMVPTPGGSATERGGNCSLSDRGIRERSWCVGRQCCQGGSSAGTGT